MGLFLMSNTQILKTLNQMRPCCPYFLLHIDFCTTLGLYSQHSLKTCLNKDMT